MSFGLNVTGDAFQQTLEVFCGLQGVTEIADDMFIYRRTEVENDQILTSFLNRTRQYGLKIRGSKIQYKNIYGILWLTVHHQWIQTY